MPGFRHSAVLLFLSCCTIQPQAQRVAVDTAWRNGSMQVNVADVIGRSDIVLGRPNKAALEALPLGNGRLGVSVWSENGFTAQLNRADTMPFRYSPGQVVIPGLAALTAAPDYSGRLNLYNGTVEERGSGMTATVYVQPQSDTLIIDVTGADPAKTQTAILKLWEPRHPQASLDGATGILTEKWADDKDPGASGRTFGSLSAITAEGRSVSAAITGPRTITVTVMPDAHGHFRILAAAPRYQGEDAEKARGFVAQAMSDRGSTSHMKWWNDFWHHANVIKVSSQDGSGEYMENLRNIYLFSSAAENGGDYPGSQAGVGDLFSAVRDEHQWDPAAFWHWNLRMQIAANLSAGLPELNDPYFKLYRENLSTMKQWTKERMQGAPGICIPETMRFNGNGIEYETWIGKPGEVSGWNCDAASGPYYNARTLSTGAEVSLWVWQQYLITGNKSFLAANFPLMAEAVRFLLSYEKPGADGLLHTSPSNAHETQWDVSDPTTDLAARQALYSATIAAATLLHQEPELVAQMRAALPRIPSLPRTSVKLPTVLVTASGGDMIADSYRPEAPIRNMENIGLEPVWPYDIIGDTSPLFALAQRTYFARPNKGGIDWSYDPVQAARLGLGNEVRDTLQSITAANQRYINGFAKWGGNGKEFYVEQIAMVALALQEALVQDYDGIIRVAPAIPETWDFDGSVTVRNQAKVDVQVRGGRPSSVGLEVRSAGMIRIKNPWPNESIVVKNARTAEVILHPASATVISFAAKAGTTYRIEPATDARTHDFKAIDGVPATAFKRLSSVQIGLEPASSKAR